MCCRFKKPEVFAVKANLTEASLIVCIQKK